MNPAQGEKEPVRITPAVSEKKQSKIDANLIATILCGLLAVIITWLTFYFYESIDQYLFFDDAKFKKFNQQIKTLCELGFVFSIFILVVKTFVFLLTHLLNKPFDSPLVYTLQTVKSNSFMNFIVFFGLYSYIVTQKGMGLDRDQLILIGNLFFFARFLYLGGSILQSTTGINFKQTGTVMNTIVIFGMVSQILGLDLISHLSPQA